jgi:hypothetical protein
MVIVAQVISVRRQCSPGKFLPSSSSGSID